MARNDLGFRVRLFDGDLISLFAITRQLGVPGCQVATASDGEVFLEKIAKQITRIKYKHIINTEYYAILKHMRSSSLYFFTLNKEYISSINYQTSSLSKNKYKISPKYCIGKQKNTSKQTKVPKIYWNYTFFCFLRNNPLRKKSHEEKNLAYKTKS